MVRRNASKVDLRAEAAKLNGYEYLDEVKPDGRVTIRVGDRVQCHSIRVPGPSGRKRKLVGTVVAIYRQRNGTVAIDVIDPIHRETRTAYADQCSKRR
jgi:hypothetical protein